MQRCRARGSRINTREPEPLISDPISSTDHYNSGCACDIPSVTYQYIWEPKIWSKFYSGAGEILEYFKGVADKYGLRKYIKLRHSVDRAEWDETAGKWAVKVTNHEQGITFEDHCDILINASGIFK